MSDRSAPQVFSIAAHRGFADALVAGLVPRYADRELGLARLTLLLPSGRAVRTMTEAFVRHFGARELGGLLMPRMAVVGDLDLDETLGPLLDPLGAGDAIPPAVDVTRRWLRLARIIREERPEIKGSAALRLAFDMGRTMDRLLVDDIGPDELVQDRVLDVVGELAEHWRTSLELFSTLQARWLAELAANGEVDPPDRRNRLFRRARNAWRTDSPATPIVAAGVTSASPALAQLLRTVAELPHGAVVLPDLDLSMNDAVWDELGEATTPFERGEAVTHPQYHLKLLLNRMGIARGEVQPWHRAGLGKGPPERSHAISNLFLPPEASRAWVDLAPDKRRLTGVRLMQTANPEEEAQAIALLVREALVQAERRVAVITPDRGLASRVAQHLRRWHIEADDSAGRPLAQTAAGRLLLLLTEVGAEAAAPVPLVALLEHPLVRAGEARAAWLEHARGFELALRGPRLEPGLKPLRTLAAEQHLSEWWSEVETVLEPLLGDGEVLLAEALDCLAVAGEALCGESLWAREDGRALAAFVEDVRLNARDVGTVIERGDLPTALREAMDRIAVRPPYGGHPRVAIYGLLEARMARAELVICAGLNEGTWPGSAAPDPLLAPPVLRALGVPGADFRIGLAGHDFAGALGAPEVVLSRARRDAAGPAIPSRFWLRVTALLGERLLGDHQETRIPALARSLDDGPKADPHPRPQPRPSAAQRKVRVSVTALDRLRSDPFQFYAQAILRLRELDPLDAEPSPAWRGSVAHKVLERWHTEHAPLAELAEQELRQMNAHPLMRALWRPRLLKALEWVEAHIAAEPERVPIVFEQAGDMLVNGVTVRGKVDRIDRLPDGHLAIVDYKTGAPPSGREVDAGYALQLGTLGLMAQAGAFAGAAGEPAQFEYWSLGSSHTSESGFGYVTTPILEGRKRTGIPLEDFLPQAAYFLKDALDKWILGDEPFTARLNPDAPGYATYDQLMRLDEWISDLK
ncbi:MAG: PD-(D/E)XK nuclease family protein [Croceibacterium sp.]